MGHMSLPPNKHTNKQILNLSQKKPALNYKDSWNWGWLGFWLWQCGNGERLCGHVVRVNLRRAANISWLVREAVLFLGVLPRKDWTEGGRRGTAWISGAPLPFLASCAHRPLERVLAPFTPLGTAVANRPFPSSCFVCVGLFFCAGAGDWIDLCPGPWKPGHVGLQDLRAYSGGVDGIWSHEQPCLVLGTGISFPCGQSCRLNPGFFTKSLNTWRKS